MTIDGPITILVWVNTQPLVVTVAKHSVPGSKAVKLSATVRTSDGVTVPTSSLKWQWTFQDDNTTSHQASPRHTSTEASYNVTVQVTDTSLGAAGTATILVTTPNKPAKSNHNQAGGHKHTNSKTPTGKDNGGSNDKPGSGYSSGASNPDHAAVQSDNNLHAVRAAHDDVDGAGRPSGHDLRHDPGDDPDGDDPQADTAPAEAHEASEHPADGRGPAGEGQADRRRHTAARELEPARPCHRLGDTGPDRPAGHERDDLAAGRDRRRTGGSRAAGARRVVRGARPPPVAYGPTDRPAVAPSPTFS